MQEKLSQQKKEFNDRYKEVRQLIQVKSLKVNNNFSLDPVISERVLIQEDDEEFDIDLN